MHDDLGDRMKEQYESRTQINLPRRTYSIIRIDGKAFHTFTNRCNRPFDKDLIAIMNDTALALCKNIQGSVFAYTQSDEISILLTDFIKAGTDAWFDGNIQKMVSVSASIATAYFNDYILRYREPQIEIEVPKFGNKPAIFDSRVFTIPDLVEVINYFVWRQKDCERNSIHMVAQKYYSHKELDGKNIVEQQDMIHDKGDNWNNYTAGEKRGRVIMYSPNEGWKIAEPPIFTHDRKWLEDLIPQRGY